MYPANQNQWSNGPPPMQQSPMHHHHQHHHHQQYQQQYNNSPQQHQQPQPFIAYPAQPQQQPMMMMMSPMTQQPMMGQPQQQQQQMGPPGMVMINYLPPDCCCGQPGNRGPICISIDGNDVTTLNQGGTFQIPLAPGTHMVSARNAGVGGFFQSLVGADEIGTVTVWTQPGMQSNVELGWSSMGGRRGHTAYIR